MNLLLLDEAAKQRAHDVALFAARPERWYRLGVSTWTPGDLPDYIAQFQSFRCVFTYTVDPAGALWRHLSISVARAGKLPHPVAAWTIASWFGFTGAEAVENVVAQPGPDWFFHTGSGPIPNVVLAQRIGQASPARPS